MTALALTGGRVVTTLRPVALVDADVVVDAGRVAAVGQPVPDGAARVDCSGCLVVPGNVCAHHHLYSALARGMPYHLDPPRDFLEILQRIWWRLDRALDPESVRASALVGGAEALLAGTTTVVDHHASPNAIDGSLDLVAGALGELGLRALLCYEVTDRDGPERARDGIEENRRFLAKPPAPLVRGMVGAHASFTLSEATLEACAGAARDAGAGLHIHAAEDEADERDAVARFGTRVVQRLAHTGALEDTTLLAHCVHLDAAEAELVRTSGATVAHNPRSNMNNGVGRTPLGWLGSRVALGTDGIGGDMFEESRAGYFRRREETLEAPGDWALATLAQSAALAGRWFGEPMLGSVVPGAPADLAVLDYPAPATLSASTYPGHWVFGLSARTVRDVLVAGELVVRDRRLVRVDPGELAARAAEQARRLFERLEELGPHSFQPQG